MSCPWGGVLGDPPDGPPVPSEDAKKTAIAKWESPLISAKEVRRFMGIVSYYRNFVPQLATIAEPLTRLTRKRVHMEWG